MAVVHNFVSLAPEGADPSKVRTSHWNADHSLTGGTNGDLLVRSTGASDGQAFIASSALGQVLCSGGVGSPPAFSSRPLLELVTYTGSDPVSPPNNSSWALITGTTPTATWAWRARAQGVTFTIISVTF
jgi:hypothetical protein